MCEGRGVLEDLVKVKYSFCDINRAGCPRLTQPGCKDGGITADSACLGAHYHRKFIGRSNHGGQWKLLGLF